MMKLDNYTAILLEEIRDQFRAVIEMVSQMQDNMQFLAKTAELEVVKDDISVIKKVVTDISRQQKDHEKRITKLESVHAG